jgi:hypothetical protein
MNFNTNDLTKIAAGLDMFEIDCAITVALKITDDSCKMDEQQRALFMALYDHLPEPKTELFDETVFHLIEIGRKNPSSFIFSEIRELREMAMEEITRPKMKAFKASIRKKITAQKIIN